MKIVSLLLLTLLTLYAAPAFGGKRLLKQSDGSSFYGYIKGDEYLHFVQTEDGEILIFNPKTKNFDYAIIANNRLIPSGTPYTKEEANLGIKRSGLKKITQKELETLRKAAMKRFRDH